jgi:hypothetical protein
MALGLVRDGADALTEVARLNPFLTSAEVPVAMRAPAVDVWARHHPEWTPWLVTLADRSGNPRAAVPLARRRGPGGVIEVCRAGSQDEEGAVAAVDAEAAGRLGDAVVRELSSSRRPWLFRATNLRDGPLERSFAGAFQHTVAGQTGSCPQAVFAPGEPVQKYLSRNMRSAAHRAENRAMRRGEPFDSSWTSDPALIAEQLPELLRVHRDRNRRARGRAILDDPAASAYFSERAVAMAEQGVARLLSVRTAGRLAAFALCFQDGDVLRVHANLVAPEAMSVSAGTYANAQVVIHAHADPMIGVLSWGLGIQRYKLSCSTRVLEYRSLVAFRWAFMRRAWTIRRRAMDTRVAEPS